MAKRFFPFGPFLRDSSDYDSPALDEARNVLPVHGVYRPVRMAQKVSESDQFALGPWVDFNGVYPDAGKVTFTGNPCPPPEDSFQGVAARFRVADNPPLSTEILRTKDPGNGIGYGWGLFLRNFGSGAAHISCDVTPGSTASPSGTTRGDLFGVPIGEWVSIGFMFRHRDSDGIVEVHAFDLDRGISDSGVSSNPQTFNDSDWNALTMKWGFSTIAGDELPFIGDLERVITWEPGNISSDPATAILEMQTEMFRDLEGQISSGGWDKGHLWTLKEGSASTVFDYASSGALNGTMDAEATWEGGAVVGSGITGGLAHFYTDSQADLERFPSEDVANEDAAWDDFGALKGDNALPEDELFSRLSSKSPDDSSGAFMGVPLDGSSLNKYFEVKIEPAPDPVVSNGHTLIYRYRFNGAPDSGGTSPFTTMSVQPLLLQGSTTIEALGEIEVSAADDEWHAVAVDIKAAAAANITNYGDLRVRFIGDIVDGERQEAVPESDQENPDDWVDETGATDNLFESINDDADNSTYVETTPIQPGGTSRYRWKFTSDVEAPPGPDNLRVRLRFDAQDDGMDATFRLLEDGIERSTIKYTDISTTASTRQYQPSDEGIAKIEDWQNLEGEIIFKSHGNAAETGDGVLVPKSFRKQQPGANGSISDLTSQDGNTLDADSSQESRFNVYLEDGTDPETLTGHKLRVYAHRSVGAVGTSVQIRRGGVIFDTRDIDGRGGVALTTTPTEYTWDIPESVVDALNGNFDGIELQVLSHNTGGGTAHYDILSYDLPVGRKGRLYWSTLDLPSRCWVGVSWARWLIPDPNTNERNDITELYCGDYGAIYEVDDTDGFTDVSKSGGYASSGATPRSWAFVPFGDNILASNKINPVQVRAPGDALFSDLMTSSAKPQFAAMAVVQRHLIGFNVEYTDTGQGSGGDGSPDEWWCSAFDDPADFDISSSTGANRGRLQAVSGEVTAATGGEFALAFKPSSIHRLDWVGPTATFRQGVVSYTHGTVFPRSVVQVGRDVYFLAQDGFRVVRDGTRVDKIGVGAVNRMVTDTAFEERAIRQIDTDSIPLAESAVIGCYDQLTGLIWWAIRTQTDSNDAEDWKNGTFLLYNPEEDRWAILEASGLTSTHLWGLPPRVEASTSLSRGVGNVSVDGALNSVYRLQFERFLGSKSYESFFRTKIWSSQFIANAVGRDIQFNAARASFRMAPESSDRPDLQIILTAADDPLMQFNLDTETKNLEDANSDYWYPFGVRGEFLEVQVTFPELEGHTIREIRGVELAFEDAGENSGA